MSTKTTIVLLVLVAVGCLVVVGLDQGWFGQGAEEKPENQFAEPSQAEPESKDLFEDHPAEVTRLTIESEDLVATFAKTDDQWEIVEPIKTPALKWEVDALVRTVTGLRYTRKFEPGQPDAPSDAETGLSDPKVKVTIEYENGVATLEVGKKELLRDNTYVRLAGKPQVYVAKSNLEPTFDKQLKDFREKDLLSFKFGDAVGLEIVSREPARMLKLTRGDDREWVIDSPIKARGSREGASDLITVLNEMKAEEFVDDAPQDLSRYGLDEPFARVTLTTRSEIKPEDAADQEGETTTQPTTQPQYETKQWTILIGSFVGLQEERRHAKLSDSTAVVAVDARSANKLLPNLSEVRDKRITPANTFRINRLVVADHTESVTLEKEGNTWRTIAPEAAEADKGKVDEVIRAIRGLQAVSFVDSPDDLNSFGLDEPRVELTLYVEGQVEPEIIRVGQRSPSGRMLYVQRGGEESVSVVKAEEAEKLLVSPVSFGPRRILSVPLAQIRQIELTRDQTRTVLAKKTDRWQIYEPYEAAADESGVARILSDVASLRAREIVARGQLEAFGLDRPDIDVVVEVSPPTPPTTSPATQPVEQKPERHRILVSRQDDQVYAVMEGGDLVYQLDPAVYEHLSAELHDRKVLRFSPDQVERLEISGSEIEQKLVLARVDDAWAYPADEFFQLDDQKVQRRVQDLRGLEALRFVDLQATDPGQYGLDEPAAQVDLALADGKSISLRISARGPDEGPQRYAMVAGEPKVFVLRGEDVTKLRVTLGDFEKD